MAFNSFIKAERYARIDLGTRIELPWYEIRDTTLETDDMIAERGDTGIVDLPRRSALRARHIYYPEGEGILLYIKSSLTGDESDYVINYKTRYSRFPHETTGDQFFSEEQFEAYRNLGFHATQGFFSGRDKVAIPFFCCRLAEARPRSQGAGYAKRGSQISRGGASQIASTRGNPPRMDALTLVERSRRPQHADWRRNVEFRLSGWRRFPWRRPS